MLRLLRSGMLRLLWLFLRCCSWIGMDINWVRLNLAMLNQLLTYIPRYIYYTIIRKERIASVISILRYIRCRIFDRKRSLLELYICCSDQCQCNCSHCYEGVKRGAVFKSLSTMEIKRILDIFYEDLHGVFVYFCGGESLLRSDLPLLISYAVERNLVPGIITNGILLSERVDELKKSGLCSCMVSIDNFDSMKHDELRNYKGAFNKAMRGISAAIDQGIFVVIWTYVSRSNWYDVNRLGDIAKSFKHDIEVYVNFPKVSGRTAEQDNFTLIERENTRKNIKYPVILEFPNEKTRCHAGGRYHLAIQATGDITPCPPIYCSYGNIREDDLVRVLNSMREDFYRNNRDFCGQCAVNNLSYHVNSSGEWYR